MATSIDTNLQHVELLARKRARLTEVQRDAEAALLAVISREYRAARLSMAQMVELYDRYRAHSDPGYMKRWDAVVELPASLIQAEKRKRPEPVEPESGWLGEFPFADQANTPRAGTCVVYVLFDESNTPCYVGSTNHLRSRLKAHHRDGKSFVRWQARSCPDRRAAYVLERVWLRSYLPYLNRKAS